MPPAPANPAQIPTALARSSGGKMLVIVESVPGMIRAAPMPIRARYPISWPDEPANARERGGAAEEREPDEQRAPAAVAIAERAGREEERGQGQRVGVDDPLLVRLAGPEVGRDLGERVRQHRHAGHDHDHGQAHHGEDEGAALGAGRCRDVRGQGAHGGCLSIAGRWRGDTTARRAGYTGDLEADGRSGYYTERPSALQPRGQPT